MATTEDVPENDDRQVHRRRQFSTWVKKLTNFKNSDGDRPRRRTKKNKRASKSNNPYPESGHIGSGDANDNRHTDVNDDSAASFTTGRTGSLTSLARSGCSSGDERSPPTAGASSAAGTASTEQDAARSLTAPSHGASSLAGTSRTVGGGLESRRGDSTFSSPAPSVRSLATTLTTIQSVAPNGNGNSASTQNQNQAQSIQFSQPFPGSSPASAIPHHLALAPTGNPTTYTSATANNLLTDNASILTLASSSKRRRRRSMDTDASVRALAPSSVWGGSRESLPLSLLSANIDSSGVPPTSGLHASSSRANAERSSLYSATGVASTVTGERNSLYAKQGDGASVRSGFVGHGRNDSVSGSNAAVSSPLAGSLETPNGNPMKSDKEDGLGSKPREEMKDGHVNE